MNLAFYYWLDIVIQKQLIDVFIRITMIKDKGDYGRPTPNYYWAYSLE